MREADPSRTAYRVALRRAAHQVFDEPVLLHDPFALSLLGLTARSLQSGELRAPDRAFSRSLRAFIVARSLFAEEVLAEAVARGATQYVLLGAGLDTFAFRNPHLHLRVFEVDHPATQSWKRDLAAEHGLPAPASVHYVPVDFERDRLADRLTAANFDTRRSTVFAWLGVVPYLTAEAFRATLAFIAAQPSGSAVVMDYGVPREMLPPTEQLALDSLAARVAAAGEPFRLFFRPEAMAHTLHAHGFTEVRDLDRDAINGAYFTERKDKLKVLGTGGHLVAAFR